MTEQSGVIGEDSEEAYVKITVSPDPGFSFQFDGMSSTEELGRPFLILLDASSDKAQGSISTLLGASLTVKLTQLGKPDRFFNGIIARCTYAGLAAGAYRYHIELRPWIWLLDRAQDCIIFQNMSPWQIMTKIFSDNGFTYDDKRQNQSGDVTLDYCVQYRETTFAFVTRLMEQYGIYYYTEHSDGSHKLVFADDSNSHPVLSDQIPFNSSATDFRSTDDHVWDWSMDANLQPGKFTYRDYNFTTPALDMTVKSVLKGDHPNSEWEHYRYPGLYDTVGNGQKLSDIRMQDFTSRESVYTGTTNARGLRAGYRFTLKNAYADAFNAEYLVTRTVTTMTIAEGASNQASAQDSDRYGGLIDTYRTEFSTIKSTIPFRLDDHTPRPMIRGPQTAKVVGQSGDEITTDQYGRVKVQFFWDRVGTNDENSSCWIRVSQSWAGLSWGSIYIPRIGMEVVVEFLEGNPDRPLITGVVYNATNMPPYGLPDNKTQTGLKTNSSSGGGGFNELRFEDKKGSEELFINAQKDFNMKVLNNGSLEITQNYDQTVKQGNHTSTISQGNHSLTVSTGGHKIDVSAGQSELTAATSITLTCGQSSIKIEPAQITISAAQININGTATVSVSAPMVKLN